MYLTNHLHALRLQRPRPNRYTVRLPFDVWQHISTFLDAQSLRNLLTVNRAWFEISMSARYSTVVIQDYHPRMFKFLIHLRNRLVFRHVKCLKIVLTPWFVPWYTIDDQGGVHLLPTTASDIVDAMTITVACLRNVSELEIEWLGSGEPAPEFMASFFLKLWQVYHKKLQRLSLHMPLNKIETVLVSSGKLPNLKGVALTIPKRHWEITHSSAILLDFITPFFNRLSPHLRQLVVISRKRELDLKPLFDHLRPMPRLEDITMSLPNLSDESALACFLSQSNSLRHVALYLPSTLRDPEPPETDPWVQRDPPAPTLLTNLSQLKLQLPPNELPRVISLAQRSTQTLKKLCLPRFINTLNDVYNVFKLFSPNVLVYLDIGLSKLSPEMLDALSKSFPLLSDLRLHIESVAINAEAEGTFNLLGIADFERAMGQRCYPNWSLYNFAITKGLEANSLGEIPKFEKRLMEAVAKSVPSIRMFERAHPQSTAMSVFDTV